MLGAIAGDIIGSVFEANNYLGEDFQLFSEKSRFTDDTVLTCASAQVLLTGGDYAKAYKKFYHDYPHCPYGAGFHAWAHSTSQEPYNSFGNGSAMRVSPVGFAFDSLKKVLSEAKRSAHVTHNHPEGVKGAQAIAAGIFLARQERSKSDIRTYIEEHFGYELGSNVEQLRERKEYAITCQVTVPQTFIVFLEADDVEDTLRKAVSIGGDSDTLACMAGALAEAFYGSVPDDLRREVKTRLPDELIAIVDDFYKKIVKQKEMSL